MMATVSILGGRAWACDRCASAPWSSAAHAWWSLHRHGGRAYARLYLAGTSLIHLSLNPQLTVCHLARAEIVDDGRDTRADCR